VQQFVKNIYMKIEILKNKKKIQIKKKGKLKELIVPEIDFSMINQLKGNKTLLDYFFHNAKLELLD
jgi:hypothetical protein